MRATIPPLLLALGHRGHDGIGVLRRRHGGESAAPVVGSLEPVADREDEVRELGGGAAIEIHRDHQVQLREGLPEALLPRYRHDRVAADHDERPHGVAVRRDVVGQHVPGQVAPDMADGADR